MRCALLGLAILLAPAPAAAEDARPASSLPQTIPEPAARALRSIGWEPGDLHFDRPDVELYGGGLYRLPLYDAWIDRPFVIPQDVDLFRKAVVNAVQKPSDLSIFAGLRAGRGVRRGLIADPVKVLDDSLSQNDPVRAAVSRIWKAAASSAPLGPGGAGAVQDQAPVIRGLSSLPEAWQRPLALILAAEADAALWRRMALAEVNLPKQHAEAANDRASRLERCALDYVLGLDSESPDPAEQRALEAAAASVDLALMQAGATDLLLVLQAVTPQLEAAVGPPAPPRPEGGAAPVSPGRTTLVLPTPLGLIAIGTTEADHYPAGDYLLVFDPAGSDRYEGGAAGTTASPVSVLIDLSGNDRYASSDSTRPSFGAGVTGIGILADRDGDDAYDGVNLTEGAGLCGVGILWDSAGDDRYEAYTAAQGAGLFGLGILSDAAGNDRYHAYQQIQGYGYTLGCGILVDAQGNDVYLADDSDIRFPSAQSKDHNSSLGQGFGFGKRADYVDGHSLAGGFGLLADGAGDDAYRCGIFGQGAGYWYGVGVLADAEGDDHYEGVWYTQGSAAHFALGVLWEGAGDDTVHSTMNMSQGAGHDFSLGLLYDRSGNDLYRAPNLSLGGGNANGFGIFWDVAGDDRYEVEAATTLGRSNIASRGGLRDRMKNLGLFLDTGGRDTYPVSKGFAGDDSLWRQEGENQEAPLPTEAGVGLDTEWKATER
jgi:hypothetical protein